MNTLCLLIVEEVKGARKKWSRVQFEMKTLRCVRTRFLGAPSIWSGLQPPLSGC